MPQIAPCPLPVPAGAPAPEGGVASGESGRPVDVRRFRVLVVDDLPAIHADFRKVLGAAEPDAIAQLEADVLGQAEAPHRTAAPIEFEIDDALQGAEGVERVRRAAEASRPYALAFVDMRMPPGQDGLQTVLDIWSIDPRVQVVICSAFSDYSWSDIIGATGETDQLVILRKPFDPIEVLQLAHALTKKWEVQQALQRQVDNLESIVAERTRELADRQALFQLILENATDLIAVVDASGRRLYNSPSYQTVLGFTPEELQTTDAFAQIHPEDLPAVKAAADTARRTGRGEMLEYRMRHRDGSWRTLESCAGAVLGPNGELAYLVIVARDTTARREQELKQQLGQKLESIGRLAAGIAHEINTPTQYITDNTRFLSDAFRALTGVVSQYRICRERLQAAGGEVDLAQALATVEGAADLDFFSKEIPQAIQQSLDGLSRIARIVGSLKEFSHPNSIDKAPTDLNHAVETAVSISRHEWKYVADVATDFDPALPPVPCMVDKINQVLLNLIVNAAHTIAEALKTRAEARGKITIRTRVEPEAVRIEVADTGMGIPPQLRSRLFEPFFTTKRVGQGTGQGLSLVHRVVVHEHRGSVDFVSEVGRGTTFRLWLPLRPDHPAEPATVAADDGVSI